MKKGDFTIWKLLIEAFIFTIFFHLNASFAAAAALDGNAVSENENEAVRLSSVWEFDSIKRAVGLFETTAGDWENLNEPQRAVFCLDESAKLAQYYADDKTTFGDLGKAIKIADKNNLIEEKIITLSLYAFFALENNDKNTAYKYSSLAESLINKDSTPRAKAYSNFGSGIYNYYYGTMPAATSHFEQADIFAQQTNDIFIISYASIYVGYSYLRDGVPFKAVDKLNSALEQCERYRFQKGIALSYIGLGFLKYHLNEKQKALDYFKKSDALFPNGFEWMEKARILTAIGMIHMDFGELETAEANFQKAVADYEQINYLLGKITTLSFLADVYILKSEPQKAKRIYETATKLSLQIDDKFRLAIIKEGEGYAEFREDNYDKAIKKYLAALKIYDAIDVKLPSVENLLGDAYRQKGDYEKAREFYNAALETTRRTKDFQQLAATLYNRARLDLDENKSAEALKNVGESISLTENLYSNVADSNLKSTFISNVFDRYEFFINLLMKTREQSSDQSYSVQALQAAEKSKARAMLEKLSLAEADFTVDADADTVKREKEIRALLNVKADKLTDLLGSEAKSEEIDSVSKEINELENRLEDIKVTLKQESPIYSAVKNPAPFDVAEFQQNILDENSLLLEFSFGKTESYLWLVGKNEFVSYVLPPREQIENKIQKLRELLAAREMGKDETTESFQTRIAQTEKEYSSISSELSRDLFGQIAGKFGNKKLIIVPDGKLGVFPIAALPLPDSGKNEPILLSNEVVYEPSALTLSLIAKFGRQAKSPTKSLLIFSDPVFSTDDDRLSGKAQNDNSNQNEKAESFRFVESLNSLERLISSKIEADSIVNILGKSDVESFSGFSANREQLINANVSDYRILHFATHGIIDENRPELSGIVLSRFDENGRKRDEFFRLHDIYGMNLNSDLVVLSACSTGVGKEVKGEGLMSLNNAFLSVGAKTVLSSLWKVEDGATLELMKNFYEAMAHEHLTPSKALQKAQIKMIRGERYKSPFYWAAFTVQGDFKNVPQISGGVAVWKYFLPMPVVLFFGAFWGFRVIRRRNRM